MSEAERAQALKAIQLELFSLSDQVVQISKRRRTLLRQMKIVSANGFKTCRKCHETMDVEQFYEDLRYADDHYPWCKECKTAASKARNRAA